MMRTMREGGGRNDGGGGGDQTDGGKDQARGVREPRFSFCVPSCTEKLSYYDFSLGERESRGFVLWCHGRVTN